MTCRKCGIETSNKRGVCLPCLSKYQREWRKGNPNYNAWNKQYQREWRKKNPDKKALMSKRWREKNPNKIAMSSKQWRDSHY